MTILELPERLPGWAVMRVDGLHSGSFWFDDCDIEPYYPEQTPWFVVLRLEGNINAYIYPQAIRRK